MYSLGRVSYINSLPLFCGGSPELFSVVEAVPARLNRGVRDGALDASLISRWTYTKQIAQNYEILPQFCIGGDGEIFSVKLFSRYPIEELCGKKIFITGESGTSIRAFALICRERYKFDFFANRAGSIAEADAVFLIGDAALAFDGSFGGYSHVYDLGRMWKEFAPVPMIYAVVVVRRNLPFRARARLSDFFGKSVDAFRASPESFFPVAKDMFARSTSSSISDGLLDAYYRALIYKFDEKTFYAAIRFVDECADI